MFVTLIVLIVSTLAAYVLYRYKWIHVFFDKRGIKYVPGVPIFGNIYQSTFYKRHTLEDMEVIYKAFPDEKYVGYIEGMLPIIMIRDPEIMRNITVKHFEHFIDHKEFFSPEIEPLFGSSLLLMKGDRWRDMRTTLSPAFTSSKMRQMMPFMTSITSNIIEHLRNHLHEDIGVDDLVRRYTNDVIASTAFGVQVNSIKDKDNEFYKTGQDMFNFGIKTNILMFASTVVPSLLKKLGVTIFPGRIMDFFTNLISVTMDHREKNNIFRPDMIQLMMETAKGTLKGDKDEMETKDEQAKPPRQWTRNELMGQMFIFFAAGFESSASAVALSVHELALNPDVQEKLYQEIREHKEQNNELTFEGIATLKYLDCVINETLRKWSPALMMDRVCTKAYELPPPREGAKPVKLNPGDIVYNMVNLIQMDPKYFPNPEVFDPDRFRDDKKHIKPFTFMPFGMGPRNCIALRFAMLEVKVLLYHLIENFKLLKCMKTTDPIKLKPHAFNIKSQGGTWVQLESRQ